MIAVQGNGAVLPEVDVNPGFILKFEHEFGVHLERGFCQRLKPLVVVGIAVGQHAAGSVRCFTAWFATFQQQGLAATLVQLERDTKADYASAYNDRVPTLHSKIVANGERWRDVSVRQPIARLASRGVAEVNSVRSCR